MTRKMYLFVFFSISQSLLSFASNLEVPDYPCEVEEEIINPYVYEQKVSQQCGLGICFVHSSLQTYRALYEEIFGERIAISPLYAALYINSLGYKRHTIEKGPLTREEMLKNVESGHYDYALKDFKRLTPCSAQKGEEFLKNLTSEISLKKQIQKANDFLELYDKYGERLDLAETAKKYDFNFKEILKFKNYLHTYDFEKEKFHIHKKSYTKTLYKFFMHLGKCSERKKLSYKIKKIQLPKYSAQKILQTINSFLTKKNHYPLGLSYQPKRWDSDKEEGFNHSSIIYGKTCKNKKLYYLVRNSWGGKSLKEIRAETHGDFSKELEASQNIYGDFWINPNRLKEAWTKDYGGIHILKLKKKNFK